MDTGASILPFPIVNRLYACKYAAKEHSMDTGALLLPFPIIDYSL